MTIHFAPARQAAFSPLARAFSWRTDFVAANDDCPFPLPEALPTIAQDDAVITPEIAAALRHFGKHGLNSAAAAWEEAEVASDAGDHGRYGWWLSVCRAFDAPYARQMARKHGAGQDNNAPA